MVNKVKCTRSETTPTMKWWLNDVERHPDSPQGRRRSGEGPDCRQLSSLDVTICFVLPRDTGRQDTREEV